MARLFDDQIIIDEGLSQIRPGWNYCRIMTPTAEWQIKAYLDRLEDQSEAGPTTPSMGGYQVRFV